MRGDESNQLEEIDDYTVVNFRTRYQINDKFEVYVIIQNLFDKEFETFGLLGEEPNELEVPIIQEFEVPLFLGPAPPRAAYIGLRYSF